MGSRLTLCSGRPNTGRVRGQPAFLQPVSGRLMSSRFVASSHPRFNVNLMLHVVRNHVRVCHKLSPLVGPDRAFFIATFISFDRPRRKN